jgi:tRNA-Thr(GGU) m(6)t(6)A37 methyltransferase TsaA
LETISFRPIGIIRSPFQDPNNMPIQAVGASGIPGSIDLFTEFEDGLMDLDGFSHLFLLYHFHLTRESRLRVTPFLDSIPRGVFSTRSPNHPNPIGLSIVRLKEIKGSRITIEDVDVVDGTPLLDIKPYVPDFDHRDGAAIGWMAGAAHHARTKRSDNRFR